MEWVKLSATLTAYADKATGDLAYVVVRRAPKCFELFAHADASPRFIARHDTLAATKSQVADIVAGLATLDAIFGIDADTWQ